MGIAMSVMASILGILVSQSNAEKRVSSFADNQEVLRQAIVLMQRDIRSAEPLEPLDNDAEGKSTKYALQIRLNVYEDIQQPAVPIRWIVDTSTRELRREIADGTDQVTYRLTGVANSYALDAHLFEFYKADETKFVVG